MNEVQTIRYAGMGMIDQHLLPFFNMGFFLLCLGVGVLSVIGYLFVRFKDAEPEWKNVVAFVVVLANVLSIYALSSEVSVGYDQQIAKIRTEQQAKAVADAAYRGNYYRDAVNDFYPSVDSGTSIAFEQKIVAETNRKNTAISVLWTVYALVLIVIGFARRVRSVRLFGLVFFFVTAIRVLLQVWQLGQLYRIISLLVFGIIALLGSFLYVKYKHRLKEIIYD